MLILCVVVQGVDVPIPSNLLPFIPSTLSASHAASSTSALTEENTLTDVSTPPEPDVAAIVGAVIGIMAAMFIGVIVFICWRRRRRRTRSDTRTPEARPRGMLGRLVDGRRGFTLRRADTVSSWFAGREEKDDSISGLLPKESLRTLSSLESSDPRTRLTGGVRPTTSVDQLTPPPPPPSYLKPNNLGYSQEGWTRRTSSPAPPASLSGNPFTTPSHSRNSSYDLSDRYTDGASVSNSLLSTAMSTSTPFSGVRSFRGPGGNTPLSPASGPGSLQETRFALAAREHEVAMEGSVLQAPARAIAATSHSAFGPISPEVAAKGMHKRNLTIDTTNLGVSDALKNTLEITDAAPGVAEKPKHGRAHDPNLLSDLAPSTPNDRVNSGSDDDAARRAELQKMFSCDTPLSDYEIHESVYERFYSTPTEGCEELRSPAAPESTTMEMFGIGFGAMGGRWEPRNSESNWSTHDASLLVRLPSKKTKKGIRTPLGPMMMQNSLKRGTSVLSTSASSSHGGDPPSSPGQRSEIPSGKSSSYHSNESKPKQVMSPAAMSSLLDANRIGLGPSDPQMNETIFEVDEDVQPVPRRPLSDGDVPTSAPSGGGGTSGSGGSYQTQEPAQRRGERQGSNLTPRTAPPRRSVVPEGFSEEGSGLSSEDVRRWL